MPISSENRLTITLALRNADTVLEAIEALRGDTSKTAIDGLIELLYTPHAARPAVAAIGVLEDLADPIIDDALFAAMGSPHSSVRLVAVQALHRRKTSAVEPLRRLLNEDESWLVRRAALSALAEDQTRWDILDAATDPHWRVRHALVHVLLDRDDRAAIDQQLAALGPNARVEGLRGYLHYRWTGQAPATAPAPEDPTLRCSLWDWDVFVLARELERLGESGREEVVAEMPYLLGHPEERVRLLAIDTLASCGTAAHLAAAVAELDEPRKGTVATVAKFFSLIDDDRIQETADFILQMPAPSAAQRAWALAHIEVQAEDCANPTTPLELGNPLLATVQADPHPHVRAAAMTLDRAAELIAYPERETSWHVLARAAHLMKVPLWEVEPEERWKPDKRPPPMREPLRPRRGSLGSVRLLGPDALKVAPIGISGHYGLPVEGFVRAFEAGVNLMFWEPSYQPMTDFTRRLSGPDRESILFSTGTFEADGKRVRRDVERALRQLQLERLSFFLLFWVQNWRRITPDVMEALERLKEEGKVSAFGLSTHSRPLALTALESGWNPVMVRHSAAHRGAEHTIFPKAVVLGVGLITFNNTCYGRLLQPQPGLPTPTAADCYRYALEQPGVSACLSAPATLEELEENLNVLVQSELPPDRRTLLLAQGERVYQEDTIFRKLIRAL